MKSKRIDLNYRPLRFIISMFSTGVSTTQSYDQATGEYKPNYIDLPLTVRLEVRVQDPDGVVTTGIVNGSLTNIVYYLNIDGTKTQLVNGVNGVTIFDSGSNRGSIKIANNLVPKGKTASLEVTANYTDTRTKQVSTINGRISLFCSSETLHEKISLDSGTQKYDPFQYDGVVNNQQDKVSITATHRCGDSITAYDATKLKFVWHKKRSDGSFSEVGSSLLDYDCEISGTCGQTLTLSREFMGDGVTLRCYALFAGDGTVASKSITDLTPMETITHTRSLPSYDYEMTGVPLQIPVGSISVNPQISVMTNKGTVSNAELVLLTKWYAATNTGGSSASFTEVAHGASAEVPCKYIVDDMGMLLGYEAADAGAKKALVDASGRILVDAEGKILIG